jgi:hypothetical protein
VKNVKSGAVPSGTFLKEAGSEDKFVSGALTNGKVPSGRQMATPYDAAGRASKLTGTLGGEQRAYMNWVRCAPHGAVDAMQMGNNVWRVYTYNSRLQVQRILDAVDNSPNQLLLDQQFSWGASDNNGNLQSVLANPGTQLLTLKEAFGYDKLNRVTSVVGKSELIGVPAEFRDSHHDSSIAFRSRHPLFNMVRTAPQHNPLTARHYS